MGVAPADHGELLRRHEELTAQAAEHKRLAGHHRTALRRVMTDRARIEAECRRLGIGFYSTDKRST